MVSAMPICCMEFACACLNARLALQPTCQVISMGSFNLNSLPPQQISWCRRDALDKFGVVNVQMHRLSQELRPLLHYYAVHPKVNCGNLWAPMTIFTHL